MDYRCPVCGTLPRKRRLSEAVVTRMETECAQCKTVLRLNIHPAEMGAVFVIFGAIVALGLAGYWSQERVPMLAAFGVAMAGALAVPLIEKKFFRTWPRYVPAEGGAPGEHR